MITISASELKENLQRYLEQVAQGETVVIREDHHEVARLVPGKSDDWRDQMTIKPRLKVSVEEFIKPLDDVWDDYT